jgi:sensor histidine kinase YesM
MDKDVYLRIVFVPLLGMGIPYVSGIINYALYPLPESLAAYAFFILTSFVIWSGSSWKHKKQRHLFGASSAPFTKMAAVISANALFGACIGGLSALTWYRFSRESFSWSNFYKFVAICMLAVIVFTLLYEIIFLSKEREQDVKLVKKMDRELTQAELMALTNEMDPHFIFNSLNAMNHLILNNPTQAHLFNNHLAQVYKYFLLNKNRKLISLQDELEFIKSYFFLLEIRYDKNIRMQQALSDNLDTLMIPPCAIQVLIENAIKHNEFSESNPLDIDISMNGQYLEVSNKTKLKTYPHNSTNIGLKNLSLRFKLICQKEIFIENNPENFTVRLPLIHQSNKVSHDQSNYYRG